MANNCSACNDLQRNAPEFYTNGVTTNVCTSLKNNTGLNPANGNDNDTDIQDVNACLVGNMESEIKAYDVCDWKEFMKKFIPNIFNALEVLRCAVGGMWSAIKKLQCQMNFAFKGVSRTYSEEDFYKGIGVSLDGSSDPKAPVRVRIRGNTVHAQGTIEIKCRGTVNGYNLANYWGALGLRQIDGGDNPRMDIGGSVGDPDKPGRINTPNGNYRIAILPIKKTDVPQVGLIRTGVGSFNNAACGQVTMVCRDGDEGQTYPGYWGDGTAGGGTVPAGYYYLVIGLSNLITWGVTAKESSNYTAKVTFDIFTQCEINNEKIDC